ncbi:hypothetical protein SASPL_152700 [Salvia splendens]|uniref:Uncharacterized protein n=1 Tax=Salvia splendens TaxID=180675 RepID=A0A8X8Z129_SALSN|nr:hypothetical protein SASPL_152700 [Salvia splendens]
MATVEFLYEAEATLEEDIGTRWDKPSNKVFASERTRTALLKASEFLGAYTIDGEPEYKQMQMIFGGEGLKLENNEDVITFSDTTLEAEFEDTNRLGKAHVSGQSSSAAGKQKVKMNPRKLFDGVGNASDRESTNDKGTTRSSNATSSRPNAWWRRPYE